MSQPCEPPYADFTVEETDVKLESESEPCPIDVAFREVDDTLVDFGVSQETRARLAAQGLELSEVYQAGERVVIATRKAIPKVQRLWDKVTKEVPFLGRREVMKRGM